MRLMGISARRINIYRVDVWLFAICLLLSIPPYFLWQLSSPYFALGCLLIALKYVRLDNSSRDIGFMLALSFLYILYAFINTASLRGAMFVCLLVTFFFTDRDFMRAAFDKFVLVFSVTVGISILQYVLVIICGIDMPYDVIPPLNKAKSSSYLAYAFFVVPNNAMNLDLLPRFCGLYDEPGVVGTLSGMMLMTQKFNLRKWVNIPILIGGILSFSLFFYVLLIAYILFFARLPYKILTVVICASLYGVFQESEVVNQYILARIEIEDGDFSGNNRTHGNFDVWYKTNFINSDSYFFGLGAGASARYNPGGASYRDIIVNCGIIFFVAYMATFTLWALHRLKLSKEFLMYLLILYGTIYQRPFIDAMVYLFLLFIPVIYMSAEKKGKPSGVLVSKSI